MSARLLTLPTTSSPQSPPPHRISIPPLSLLLSLSLLFLQQPHPFCFLVIGKLLHFSSMLDSCISSPVPHSLIRWPTNNSEPPSLVHSGSSSPTIEGLLSLLGVIFLFNLCFTRVSAISICYLSSLARSRKNFPSSLRPVHDTRNEPLKSCRNH